MSTISLCLPDHPSGGYRLLHTEKYTHKLIYIYTHTVSDITCNTAVYLHSKTPYLHIYIEINICICIYTYTHIKINKYIYILYILYIYTHTYIQYIYRYIFTVTLVNIIGSHQLSTVMLNQRYNRVISLYIYTLKTHICIQR